MLPNVDESLGPHSSSTSTSLEGGGCSQIAHDGIFSAAAEEDDGTFPIPKAFAIHPVLKEERIITCNPASDTVSTFAKFTELPTEIRLRIWRLAAANPRIVPVEKRRRNYRLVPYSSRATILEGPWEWKAVSPPALFLVNVEAGQEARNVFNAFVAPNDERACRISKAPLYIRPELDFVYFEDFDFTSPITGLASPHGRVRMQLSEIEDPDFEYINITSADLKSKDLLTKSMMEVLNLAVAWEAYMDCTHPPETIIRWFFPELVTLVLVLKDHEIGKIDCQALEDDVEAAFDIDVERFVDYGPPTVYVGGREILTNSNVMLMLC